LITTAEAMALATAELEAAGSDTPRLDAEVLLAATLRTDRTALFLDPRRTLLDEERDRYRAFVARRAEREPVAYITGTRAFRHLDLHVDRRVLIPRPETEHVVEAALELAEGAIVVDVGTGSGAIALALKHERPDLRVIGTDVSSDALEVARDNAERLGLEVEWYLGDLHVPRDVDAVVSNPPYVADRDPLPPDVERFEPSEALMAGLDGLDVYRRLVPRLVGWFAAIEVGEGQADAVAALMRFRGFETETVRDLAGIERVVVGRR
jgi:release factor glutamine methyltransferase